MFETLARLVERLAERPQQPSPSEDLAARWMAVILMVTLVAIAYHAPKEAYVLLAVVLLLVFLFLSGRGKTAA